MAIPEFSIGIDLGTTNCAMAFQPLAGGGSEIFPIPQWESATSSTEAAMLPSFLFLARSGAGEAAPQWIAGRMARRQAADTPERVAHSAKSWLGHHAVDREAAFLPWGSDEIPPAEKLSPIAVSALLLAHLRTAWDAKFPNAPFNGQILTITVPASFDPAAQRLTLEAARQAGFPDGVRLLEEPQAAFYRWLEAHGSPDATAGIRHVAVIDIGGGTSDFSLFEIRPGSPLPHVRRVAVSDHLLLGGDNIDLAIAHRLEPQFVGTSQRLPGRQWNDLVARCRDLKERCLSGGHEGAESVSLPGRGSGLFSDTASVRVDRQLVRGILIDGFFPDCPADARPEESASGLKEWGLPYAADSAITRHLAQFLSGHPPVDHILFNGGALRPEVLRNRIREQIARWQPGTVPAVLDSPEPDLAVARGAARFGALGHRREARIEAAAARAVYLEAGHRGEKPDAPTLVCILPMGAGTEQEFSTALPGLELRLNQPVLFHPFVSTRRPMDAAGSLVAWNDRDFQRLPSLQTTARLDGRHPQKSLPVTLSARLSELGALEVSCASSDPNLRRQWPLAFNLRQQTAEAPAEAARCDPGIDPDRLEAARADIAKRFSLPPARHEKFGATHLLKGLEKISGLPKAEWSWALLRALWPALASCAPHCADSVEHEEAWLILCGFLLRPGFGGALDASRIDDLWQLRSGGPSHAGKRVQLQEFILWRRVAGGLSRERQHAVLAPRLPALLSDPQPSPELVRLAGALERIDLPTKTSLFESFLAKARSLADDGGHCAPFLVALGMLLNRSPLYAGPEAVVSPSLVERAFQELSDLDWSEPDFLEAQTLFLRAARVVNDRHLDLPKSLRERIASKLEKAGVPAIRAGRLRQFVPVESGEQSRLFGEALPPGLVLSPDRGR